MTPRRTALAIGAVIAIVSVVGALSAATGPPDDVALGAVAEGPFDLTIVETGSVQPLKSVSYASSIQSNQAKIVAIAPEGRFVQKGDLLILFDATPFEEQIRESEGQLAQARAEAVKARQELTLQEIQNTEDIAAAQQKEAATSLELRDVEEGEGLLREREARAELAETERALQRAVTTHEDLKPLLKEGFITRQEIERASQEVEKAREAFEIAKRRHDAFFAFSRPLERAQAQADARATRDSAKAMRSVTASRTEQRRAALEGSLGRVREAESRLQTARAQLARCEIRADVPGIVVYRTLFFGAEQRKPQVGDQVWANQPLLILPDVSRVVVETRVRETDIHRVSSNQKARIRIAAYPDLALTGAVSLVGTLALEEPGRRGGKFFGITIAVEERDERLRPGMTATVEILIDRRERAIYAPIQSVFERDGRRVVYVWERGSFHERAVRTGPSNRDFVVIEEGLAAGDRVALSDPRL